MNETTMAIIIAVIGFIGTVCKILYPIVKNKITAQQMNIIIATANVGVYAAEQLCKIGKIDNKKEYVIKYIKDKFPKMTEDDIEAVIEAVGKQTGLFE